jgi:hypothetical protein
LLPGVRTDCGYIIALFSQKINTLVMEEKLFDDIERNGTEPMSHSGSVFEYLNTSGRKTYISARGKLEEWFARYKKLHGKAAAKELRGRLRNKDNEIHSGALTELFLHNLLLANDYRVQLHPTIPGRTTHPDFLVSKGKKKLFYLEARMTAGTKKQKMESHFQAKILDAVDSVNSPDYLICVDFDKTSISQPPLKKIKNLLQKTVQTLDYEKVCQEKEAGGDFPSASFREGGWEIGFEFIPVKDAARKKRTASSRVIGSISYPAIAVNIDEEIKKATKKKLSKYGTLSLPLLIAVNVARDVIFCDDNTIMSALFGKVTVTFSLETGKSYPGRTFDGILVNPKLGKISSRLSGLFILEGLGIHNLSDVKLKIWKNPHAKRPYETSSLNVDCMSYNPKTGSMEMEK